MQNATEGKEQTSSEDLLKRYPSVATLYSHGHFCSVVVVRYNHFTRLYILKILAVIKVEP